MRKWTKAQYNAASRDWRRTTYGITILELHELFADQDERCAICSKKLTWSSMNVDHDKVVVKVRGIICFRCNAGLGHFEDDSDLVANALEYLRKFEATL